MAGNLFDQLKKAGLINEQKAKQVKKEKYQQTKQKKGKKGGSAESDAAKLAAEAAQQKAERDRQLNLERQQAQEKKAEQAALRQLIESNRINGYEGDVTYNFADDGKVKSLQVNKQTRQKLVAGDVRIARFNGGYVLLSLEAAEKVEQRDTAVLIPFGDKDDSMSEEDREYYAKFEIPDDLMW
ncbi:DUF2058 domain-containing protein [Thiomicrorhabdus sp.]|uniref:DUF2058 domain-containing protein n=1 Tax=Thiomicrorhabdus sp. TaxID=2039724 RepID=UPI003561728C